MGKYIYAVIDTTTDKMHGELLGLDSAVVHTISLASITAVVSDLPDKRIRPERKNLAAHNSVIKLLMAEEHSVLPVKFGTLANSLESVLELLRENNDQLILELNKVRGRVEMGLHVKLDVPNVFEYMVNSQPELSDFRDRVYGKQRGPTQMDQIELGSMFDRLLNKERERYTTAVVSVLSQRCADIKENPPREGEVMNLACLVDRNAQQIFENSICEAANLFDHHFSFDFNGPWAPHNFVDINLIESAYVSAR